MKADLVAAILDLHQSLPKTSLTTYDVGNSSIKAGIFKQGELISRTKLKELDQTQLEKEQHIVCSVRKNIKSTFVWKQGENTFIDAPTQYQETLGHDRLVCVSHLYQMTKALKCSILVVDLGTFITADLVAQKGHAGGFIFPGIETFLKSYGSGELLPRLSKKSHPDPASVSWPRSTETAIRGAAELYLKGLALELIKMAKEEKANILLTGGSADLILPFIPSEHRFEVFEELLHYSLYFSHCKIANL
jgi:type III pantothenate kinase